MCVRHSINVLFFFIISNIQNHVSNFYYSCVNEFTNNFRFMSKGDINILQLNVRIDSVNKFNSFVGLVHNIDVDIGVIVVAETWLSYGHSNLYNIAGYTAYHSCRCGDGGGVSIYVKFGIEHRFLCLTDTTFNSIQIELVTNRNEKLKILGYYRPPYQANLESFLIHESC